jgi:hypothetical protein
MRKVLGLVFSAMLLTSVCFADAATDSKYIYTYTIRNDLGTSKVTIIPVTSIYPNDVDRIIGYSIEGDTDGASAERWIEVYDASTTALSGEVMAESEAPQHESQTVWFPSPRTIANGVAVRQGANTIAIIFFTRG